MFCTREYVVNGLVPFPDIMAQWLFSSHEIHNKIVKHGNFLALKLSWKHSMLCSGISTTPVL